MAAMFYILSLLFYVKARLSNSKGKKLALFLACIISGMLSLGSKEIAATLPFFVFLYEWYFFQDSKPEMAETKFGLSHSASYLLLVF